jgi:hypothetical protein
MIGARIDLRSAFNNQPPELDYVWYGFPVGTVGALIAPDIARSLFSLEASVAVAGANIHSTDILGLKPQRAGKVVYLSANAHAFVFESMLHNIGTHLSNRVADSGLGCIGNNLLFLNAYMARVYLETEYQQKIMIAQCMGARLIVFNSLDMFLFGEHSNSGIAQLMAILENMAYTTGASILVLHHEQNDVLLNRASWCGILLPDHELENTYQYDVLKTTAADDMHIIDDVKRFETNSDGVLIPIKAPKGLS